MANTQYRPVAVITGASSGVGKAAAKQLAANGWHVIAHGRTPERAAAALAEINAEVPNAHVDMILGDLASMADSARLATEVTALTTHVDLLLNNAGGVRAEKVITPEGNEATFAGNHLGHFLLTLRLLPLLKATAQHKLAGSVRIINTTSDGHKGCPGINWDDLQLTSDWNTGKSYCLAKLANILFARELTLRLKNDGIIAHAFHPGTVDSNFVNHADARMRAYIETLQFRSAEDAAADLLWIATDPVNAGVESQYFEYRQTMNPAAPAMDASTAVRLWQESEALIEQWL